MPSLTKIEFLILHLLSQHGSLYGLELVRLSKGTLKRGSVYTTLMRMGEKGYVVSKAEKDEYASGMPRRKYSITGVGESAYREEAISMNFKLGECYV